MLPSLRNLFQSIIAKPLGRALPTTPPERALLLRTDRIGDHVLFSAFVDRLASAWPKTHIAVVGLIACEELYRSCPLVETYFAVGADKKARHDLYRQITFWKPDWIINPMPGRPLMPDRIVHYCHAPVRVGWGVSPGGDAHSKAESYNPYYTHLFPREDFTPWFPEAQRSQLFLDNLGIPLPQGSRQVWSSPADRTAAAGIYLEAGMLPEKTVVLCPGASDPLRTFPRLPEYMSRLLAELDITVLATGMATDHARGEPPAGVAPARWRNISGRTTLLQTAELMRLSRMVIAVDSGPAHLAAAVRAPHVIAMNGTNLGRFMPANSLTSLVLNPLDCFMCESKCRFDRPYCVTDLAYPVFRQAVVDAFHSASPRPRVYLPKMGEARLPEASRPKPIWKTAWLSYHDVEMIEVSLHVA